MSRADRTVTCRPGRALALIALVVTACQGEGDVAEQPLAVPPEPARIIRFAGEQCRPFDTTDPPAPWAAPDTVRVTPSVWVEMQGCDTGGGDWRGYTYEGRAPRGPYHVIHVAHYEHHEWILLNAEAETWQFIDAKPVFSPDGAWFATTEIDEFGARFEPPTALDIWRLGPDSAAPVFSTEGDRAWGAEDARWVSPSRLEFVRLHWGDNAFLNPWDTAVVGVALRDGVWEPTGSLLPERAEREPPS